MSKIEEAISQIEQLNSLNKRDQWVNRIHPLVKLSLTIIYVIFVVSFAKYNIGRLIVMAIYPLFVFEAADLSIKECIYRLRVILPIVIIMGIFNPVFDREIMITVAGIGISGGWMSFISLMIKGVLTCLGVYILAATTSIEDICYSLRLIKVPSTIVTVVLLIYRYMFTLFREAEKIWVAYKLRAPGQKGVHFSAWGSLVGQLLLRSMDKAEYIYESMELRGYNGEFSSEIKRGFSFKSFIYLLVWVCIFTLIRHTDVLYLIGGLFV